MYKCMSMNMNININIKKYKSAKHKTTRQWITSHRSVGEVRGGECVSLGLVAGAGKLLAS